GILRRQRLDRAHALGQGLGNFAPVPRYPDAGTVDATPAAVDQDAFDHDVQVLLPVIDLVIAEDDLAESGAVSLDARIALVLLNGGGAAEDQATRAMSQHRGADVAQTGIDGHGVLGHPGLNEGLRHAIRSPRLLRARLENQADLERDNWQPKGVHARRVA